MTMIAKDSCLSRDVCSSHVVLLIDRDSEQPVVSVIDSDLEQLASVLVFSAIRANTLLHWLILQ